MAKADDEWLPSRSHDTLRWDLPAQGWSRAEFADDTIKIQTDLTSGEWWACVERDQCVHRDLDAEEMESVRAEFALKAVA